MEELGHRHESTTEAAKQLFKAEVGWRAFALWCPEGAGGGGSCCVVKRADPKEMSSDASPPFIAVLDPAAALQSDRMRKDILVAQHAAEEAQAAAAEKDVTIAELRSTIEGQNEVPAGNWTGWREQTLSGTTCPGNHTQTHTLTHTRARAA